MAILASIVLLVDINLYNRLLKVLSFLLFLPLLACFQMSHDQTDGLQANCAWLWLVFLLFCLSGVFFGTTVARSFWPIWVKLRLFCHRMHGFSSEHGAIEDPCDASDLRGGSLPKIQRRLVV